MCTFCAQNLVLPLFQTTVEPLPRYGRLEIGTSCARADMCHADICNYNYILFTKLLWQEDSEGTFWSSSQAGNCPPAYHTRQVFTLSLFNAEHQAGKLLIPIFIVLGLILTRPGVEPYPLDH